MGLFLALIGAQGGVLVGASLEENSPFIPFDYVGSQAPIATQKGGIEFRGVLDYGDELRFSFYNPSSQKSVWVKLNDRRAPYLVDAYDPVKQIVTVMVNGNRQRLELSKSSDGPMVASTATLRLPTNISMSPQEDKKVEQTTDNEGDEDTEESEPEEEDPEVQRRREMSQKVYEAFKKYVSEKKAKAAGE